MSTIIPESARIKNAVKWISEQLRESPESPKKELIHKAILRFDLNPNESRFLLDFYQDKNAPAPQKTNSEK
jgi:hypothetical protein